MVAAGTCTITLTSAGARTLTANYAGDANFTVSSDTEPHTVNDPPPTLSINDVSVTEGNAGTVTMTFTVTRTGTTPNVVSFNYATADNTATAPSDYVSASGTGTIPSGGTTGTTTISVTIKGDTLFEANETFFVNLSSPVNATIADAQGIGTITNDDVAVSITTVTLPNPSVGVLYGQSVAATGGSGSYTFSLSAGTLPTGIFLSTGGVLSGTTNQVGSFFSTIAATDANSQTASRAYTLTVAAPSLTLTPPAGALTANFGVAYSQTSTAGGSAGPFNYALTGALPGGLSFAGGTLSGPPTAAGSFPITVTATDTLLTRTGAPFSVARNYTLTVNALAPGVPTIGAATPGNAQASIAFTAPAASGSAITSYTVTCKPGGVTGTAPTSPIIVTGLTNGNAYTCSVVATNGVGSGGASATVAVTIGAACAAGAWSASGFTPCAAAAPGYFVATAGAMMQTACLPGNYQPASGQTTCLPAQAGFYATGPAATAQLPCALGSTSAAAASVCTRLPLLNMDDSDAPDVYSPSTDGTLLLDYLLGLRGTALTGRCYGHQCAPKCRANRHPY